MVEGRFHSFASEVAADAQKVYVVVQRLHKTYTGQVHVYTFPKCACTGIWQSATVIVETVVVAGWDTAGRCVIGRTVKRREPQYADTQHCRYAPTVATKTASAWNIAPGVPRDGRVLNA